MIQPNDVLWGWARRKGLSVHREDIHPNRSFYYISRGSNTFQVVVEPEVDELIRIDGHLIEGPDGVSEHFIVVLPSTHFGSALELMQNLIEECLSNLS